MGRTMYRVTGLFLSLTILVLGTVVTVLLYYAGNFGIKALYQDKTGYGDKSYVMIRRMVTADWYGTLMLKGWGFGFISILPGVTGFVAALFYHNATLAVHTVACVLALVVGSFLHTSGMMAITGYYVLAKYLGIPNFSTDADCRWINDNPRISYQYENEACVDARQAISLLIGAIAVMFAAWLFILADLLYRALTRNHIKPASKLPAENTPRSVQERDTTALLSSPEPPAVTEEANERPQRPRRRAPVGPPIPPATPSTSSPTPTASQAEPPTLFHLASIESTDDDTRHLVAMDMTEIHGYVNPVAEISIPDTGERVAEEMKAEENVPVEGDQVAMATKPQNQQDDAVAIQSSPL